ncbi:MAG: ABC transporter permease [Ignavibacteriales bacterium]|nr:ABC transporter permease [Ignavibacteriales bacterium]
MKIRKSKVLIGSILAFSLGPIMGAVFIVVLRNQELSDANSAIRSKALLTGFSTDWGSYLNLIAQVMGVGGIIIIGFIAAWIFGREYSDGTLKDLFVLPISRIKIILSKMTAIFIWGFFLAIAILILALILGTLLQLPGFSGQIFFNSIVKISIVTFLVLPLSTPVTFIASIGKGYLAPLTFVILAIVIAQIIGALGFASYFPWAVPGIYSQIIGSNNILNFYSYLILYITSFIGLSATILWWNYADQTK